MAFCIEINAIVSGGEVNGLLGFLASIGRLACTCSVDTRLANCAAAS